MPAFVYMVRCSDGRYYVGSTRGESVEKRIQEHNSGLIRGYTSQRLPVELVFSQEFQFVTDAIAAERQLKGWGRKKKEALIAGDWELISALSKRKSKTSS